MSVIDIENVPLSERADIFSAGVCKLGQLLALDLADFITLLELLLKTARAALPEYEASVTAVDPKTTKH